MQLPCSCHYHYMIIIIISIIKGIARTQSPANKNCAPELTTFGSIAKVSTTGSAMVSLTLGEPPS